MDIGTEVEQYRITKQLGHGGMGDVYKARDLELDRDVAVKCMRPDLVQYDEITARFRTEARTLASVRHPNIATVHRFFEQDNTLFLVMEFIPGKPFDAMLTESVPPVEQTVAMVQQALNGLGHAHDHKVVHRDIKPANLILDDHGTVKVLDFGIAHIVGESTLTGTGMMLGTPGYMAPEQLLGEKVDRRTDLYAMGIVLYQMLTGKLPFVGNSQFEAQQAHFQERPKQLELLSGKVPPALHDAVLHAIAKDGSDRFQSAGEFSAALGDTLNGISSAAPTKLRADDATIVRDPNTGKKLQQAGSREKAGGKGKLIALGTAAVLALGAGAAYFLQQQAGPAPELVGEPVVASPQAPVAPAATETSDAPESKNLATEEPLENLPSNLEKAQTAVPAAGTLTAATNAAEAGSPPPAGSTSAASSTEINASSSGGGDGGATSSGIAGSGIAASGVTNATEATAAVQTVATSRPAAKPVPVSSPEPALPSGPPTIAVVDFTASSQTAYEASLAELVVDELVNRSKFNVLEREKLNSLTKELTIQNESGLVSPGNAMRMGNLLGARLLVTGHVIDHGSSRQNYTGYGISTTKITNRLKARLEVIDLSTGAKLFSRVAEAAKENQVVQGSRADSGQQGLGTQVAKELVSAMLAAPRLKEMVEGPTLVSIAVNSSPPDADVEVDGTYYGTAGKAMELLPGTHQIKVSLPGYTAWEKRVLVKEGTKLMARLQKVDVTRTEATINVNSN